MDKHTAPRRIAQNRLGRFSVAGNGTSVRVVTDDELKAALRKAYLRRHRPPCVLPEDEKKRIAAAYVDEYRRRFEQACQIEHPC